MFDHFDLPQSAVIFALIGVWCLIAGRRSLSFILALTGFYLGGRLAKAYWGADSPFFIILFASCAGFAAVVLSKISKTAALNLAGFAIGGFVFSSQLVGWRMAAPQYEGMLFIVFGLLAAMLCTIAPELGLATMSSILGSGLLAQMSGAETTVHAALFVGLALAGILIQTGLLGQDFDRPHRSSHERMRM